MLSARVCKSSADHALSAPAKRFRDLRSGSSSAFVVLTLPQCESKGQEQVASFQMLGGGLQVGEERVLANIAGKLAPFVPVSIVTGLGITCWFRSSE